MKDIININGIIYYRKQSDTDTLVSDAFERGKKYERERLQTRIVSDNSLLLRMFFDRVLNYKMPDGRSLKEVYLLPEGDMFEKGWDECFEAFNDVVNDLIGE